MFLIPRQECYKAMNVKIDLQFCKGQQGNKDVEKKIRAFKYLKNEKAFDMK